MLNIVNAAPAFWTAPRKVDQMHILVVSLSRNESRMMPFFLRHYERIADEIHIYDNVSTDGTRDLIQAHPKCRLFPLDTKGETRDDIMSTIKNTHYKQFARDWVITVDIDEMIYAPDLRGLLAQYDAEGVVLPRVAGFDMVGDELIVDDGKTQITDFLKLGVASQLYCKSAVFKSHVNIGYGPGCHNCYAAGRVKSSATAHVKLLHYRWWSEQQTVERSRAIVLSDWNKKHDLGTWQTKPEIQRAKYLELKSLRTPVI